MTSMEEYTVAWKHFQANVSSGVKSLLHEESFSDVTLAVDGHYLHAHRVVLALSSSYFRHLFVNNPSQHPIVIIPEVSFEIFKGLLEFMYLGEVKVEESDFTRFMKVAEILRIKGLTEFEVNNHQASSSSMKETPPQLQPLKPKSVLPESKPAGRDKTPLNWFWSPGLTSKQEKHLKYNDGLTKEEQVLASNKERILRPRNARKKTLAAIEFEESMLEFAKKSRMMSPTESRKSANRWKDPVDVEYKVEPEYYDSDTDDLDVDVRSTSSVSMEEISIISEEQQSPPRNTTSSDCSAIGIVQAGGIPQLVINGFAFQRNSYYKTKNMPNSHSVHWACKMKTQTECPALCISVDGEIKIWPKTHNHPPDDEPAQDGDTLHVSESIPQFLCDASKKATL